MAIILLPPSEGKTPAHAGPKLKLSTLAFPELNTPREQVLAGLISLSKGSATKACKALGISTKQVAELDNNKKLLTAHCAPAWKIYTGVLFSALDANSLTPTQIKKLAGTTFVQSALFGFIGFNDLIPAYRLSGNCSLPRVGALTTLWSKRCSSILANSNELIIDFRSGTYVKLGPIPADVLAVVPKVFQKMPKGEPKVVTHHNKATKGKIVRAISTAKASINSIDELGKIVASLGADVEILKTSGKPTEMKVVVDVL